MDNDNAPMGGPLSEVDRLAEIRARLAAASSTPWEAGDVWGWAGLVWTADGTRVWDGNGTRCSYCRHSDPVDVKVRDINGEEMLAHLHRQPEPWGLDSAISDADGGLVIQSVSDPADHNLILHAPADLEFLLNLVGVLEGQLATARHDLDRFQRAENRRLEAALAKAKANLVAPSANEAQREHTTAPDTAMDEFEAADDLSRRWE